MAGLADTPAGGETRRNGDTVGVQHNVPDGTRVEDLTGDDQPEPGDVVGINSAGYLTKVDTNGTDDGDAEDPAQNVLGVLEGYNTYGASHQGQQIQGDVDATVGVLGTRKAKAHDSGISAGEYVDAPTSATGLAGEFVSGSTYRVVSVDTSPTGYDFVEVLL